MWLVCICFLGVFLKLRNVDKNHLIPLQWLSVLCIITKSVLSLKFSFCSSYKSSAVMEVNTRSRLIWEEKELNAKWRSSFCVSHNMQSISAMIQFWQSTRSVGKLWDWPEKYVSDILRSVYPLFSNSKLQWLRHQTVHLGNIGNGPHDQPYI